MVAGELVVAGEAEVADEEGAADELGVAQLGATSWPVVVERETGTVGMNGLGLAGGYRMLVRRSCPMSNRRQSHWIWACSMS